MSDELLGKAEEELFDWLVGFVSVPKANRISQQLINRLRKNHSTVNGLVREAKAVASREGLV